MPRLYTTNPDCKWGNLPRWKRRVNGVVCYLAGAFMSIFHPEATDMVLFDHLGKQFMDENSEIVAISCKSCHKMFYACTNNPMAIVDDAATINQYVEVEGHILSLVSAKEARENLTGCTCSKHDDDGQRLIGYDHRASMVN
jgi:hypothetical protein